MSDMVLTTLLRSFDTTPDGGFTEEFFNSLSDKTWYLIFGPCRRPKLMNFY